MEVWYTLVYTCTLRIWTFLMQNVFTYLPFWYSSHRFFMSCSIKTPWFSATVKGAGWPIAVKPTALKSHFPVKTMIAMTTLQRQLQYLLTTEIDRNSWWVQLLMISFWDNEWRVYFVSKRVKWVVWFKDDVRRKNYNWIII